MMLTRCPACQTVFRLRPEQLHARRGEVRCGHCFQPFNAIDNEIVQAAPAEEGPAASPTAAWPATSPAATEARPPQAPAPPPAADGDRTADLPPTSTLDFEIPDFPPFARAAMPPEPADAPPAPPQGEAPAKALPGVLRSGRRRPVVSDEAAAGAETALPQPAPDASSPALAALPSARSAATSTPPGRVAAEPGAAAAAASTTTAGDAGHAPPVEDAVPARSAAPSAPPAAVVLPRSGDTDVAPDIAPTSAHVAAAHVDIGRLDATYGRPARTPHPARRALAALAVVVLACTLLAQGVFLFRTEIGRALPELRPLLVASCAKLGCEVPLPRDAEFIAIDASDLQSEPARPGHYLLHATVNNRADYAQAWPHLELTLTDARDTPLTRRVLAPAEWATDAHTAAPLPARQLVSVRLPFDAPGLTPTGYRLYVFYP